MGDRVVEAFYDASAQYEWDRLQRHKMEFATTWRAMKEHVPSGSTILDIGGGPGRYSISLAKAGHRVTLLDLSAANVAFAKAKAEELGAKLAGFIHGDALDLSQFGDGSFDVVLLMGPLYHLTQERDREQALSEAFRVLKPGGLIFASFITRYAFLVDMLKYDPAHIGKSGDNLEQFLRTGVSIVSGDNPGFTNAYFIHPAEIGPVMESHGLTLVRLAAAEGLISMVEPSVNALPEGLFDKWLDLCYRLGTDPITWGAAEHMLYIGRK